MSAQVTTSSRGAIAWLVVAVAAMLLCLPVAWNGHPLLYPDTPTYLRGAETGFSRLLGGRVKPWLETPPATATAPSGSVDSPVVRAKALTSLDDKVVLAGRSVYYGALLYASHLLGGLWLAVLAQALCAAYLLHLAMVRLWGLGQGAFIGSVALLAALTPLGVYTGLLMPDVFAGLGILATALLAVAWRRLRTVDRVLTAAILLFGLAGHASHVATAAVMLVLLLAARWISPRWRAVLAVAPLVLLTVLLGAAVAAEAAFNMAVTRTVGAPPLRLPHPMARLIDMGPGTDMLRRQCATAGPQPFAACEFLANYPTRWDDFMFSTDPAKGAFALADAAGKRRMSDEQMRFVAAVVRDDPLRVARGVATEVLRQLGEFKVDIYWYGPQVLAMFSGRVPPTVYTAIAESPAARSDAYVRWFTAATYASVAASVLFAAVAWRRRRAAGNADGPLPEFRAVATVVVAGVLANALVCAGLASSADRFQARVVWLLAFLALAALLPALSRRRAPVPGPAAADRSYIESPAP